MTPRQGQCAEPRIHAPVGQLAPPLAVRDPRGFRGAVLRACSARGLQVCSDDACREAAWAGRFVPDERMLLTSFEANA